MDDSRAKDGREQRGGYRAIVTAGVMFLLPILYVASIGPVAWLVVRRGVSPWWVLSTFYYPLVLLAKWWPAFGRFLTWYMDWCVG